MTTIEGNFYGQAYESACRDADRLNARKDGKIYDVHTNMNAGGYQILMYRESDGECLGFYDDGNQWNLPKGNYWVNKL